MNYDNQKEEALEDKIVFKNCSIDNDPYYRIWDRA